MIYKMAFKNLLRHKRRTLLTLVTTIVGIMLAVVGEGLNGGLEKQVSDLSIKSETAYGRIFGKGYYEEKEDNDILEFPIDEDEMLALEGISITKRISFTGTITDSDLEFSAYYMGVDEQEENQVFQREKYIISGNFIKNRNDVVIGSELAKLLNVKVGDQLTLMARNINKNQNAYDMLITGIIKTGNVIFDGKAVFLSQDFAREFTGADFYNEIAIANILEPNLISQLKTKNFDFVDYKEELKDILAISKMRRKIFGMISGGILIMASLTIANTMLMAMLERKKEIGVLMANGMNSRKILQLFFLEGIYNGIIGCTLGFLIGSLITINLEKVGIPFNISFQDMGLALPFSDRMYLYYSLGKSLTFPLIGLLFVALASFYPAYKATKLNPIEAIRG